MATNLGNIALELTTSVLFSVGQIIYAAQDINLFCKHFWNLNDLKWTKKMNRKEKMTLKEKELCKTIAHQLKGSDRRLFKARIVNLLGRGGQIYAKEELGWNRRTVRKASRELASGVVQIDNFSARGRQRAEDHNPK